MLRIAHALNSQLLGALERAFPEAAAAAGAAGAPLDPQLGPASKPEFGDFQANGAVALRPEVLAPVEGSSQLRQGDARAHPGHRRFHRQGASRSQPPSA